MDLSKVDFVVITQLMVNEPKIEFEGEGTNKWKNQIFPLINST